MNKNPYFSLLLLSLLSSLVINQQADAWDAERTHNLITEYAIKQSVVSKEHGDYLRNLGFTENYATYFNLSGMNGTEHRSVLEWMANIGARLEDGNLRELNHFFNPLKPWNEAGLYGVSNLWRSTVIWSQDSSFQATWSNPSGTEQSYQGILTIPDASPLTDWSWQTTRNYFYSALTSQSDNDRQANFAKMFVGLGHQMHLLEDMSVPAHVRNNSHLFYRMIESRMTTTVPDINHLVLIAPNAVIPSVSLSNSINGFAPVARLFDTETYSGAPPIAVADTAVGLAEWTNANFFSDDTIFSPDFPHPAKADTNAQLIEIQAEDGSTDNRLYIKQNDQGYKLAAYSYIHDQVSTALEGWKYILDDQVYDDNLKLLLPRAVGYSAALLDYFFRGQIDMAPDPNSADKYIIKNLSNENIHGTFGLYYDDANGNRINVTDWTLSIDANGQSVPVSFSKPTSPEPKEKDKYILVFKGTMGDETEAVAGKLITLEDTDYRLVTVYSRSNNSQLFGNITVYAKNRVITGKLPSGYYQITAVRFDVKNKNSFVILTKEYNYTTKKSYNVFLEYSIDESTMSLVYQGVALREEASNEQASQKKIYEEDMGYMDDFWFVDGHVFYKMFLVEGETKATEYSDFYLENGNIKPFGMVTETSYSHLAGGYYTGDGTYLSDDYGIYYYLTFIQNQKLYYGGAVVQQAQPYNCTGGFYFQDDYERCQPYAGMYMVQTGDFMRPVAIFNSSDYAYSKNNQPVLTLPISINEGISKTMLRKDGQYSFTTSNKSYSSEIGEVSCGNFLIGENKIGFQIGSSHTPVVKFNSCSDWENLFLFSGASMYPDYRYDISVP